MSATPTMNCATFALGIGEEREYAGGGMCLSTIASTENSKTITTCTPRNMLPRPTVVALAPWL